MSTSDRLVELRKDSGRYSKILPMHGICSLLWLGSSPASVTHGCLRYGAISRGGCGDYPHVENTNTQSNESAGHT